MRVIDAKSRKGIPGARVSFRNGYAALSAKDSGASGADSPRRERSVAQSLLADELGVAWLPPLREGSIEIRAAAKGYRTSKEPVRSQVEDETETLFFEIALEPSGAGTPLFLRLSSGAPAAGAEFQITDTFRSGRSLFSGSTGADGRATIPKMPGPLVLLLRHPAAGGLVSVWSPADESTEIELEFPSPAGYALRFQVLRAAGEAALEGTEVAVVTDAGSVSGRLLSWLFGAEQGLAGNWSLTGLPAAPVRLLAWAPTRRQEASAGSLDSLATTVPWPWTGTVEVRAIE